MNERDFTRRMRDFYRAEVTAAGEVPATLRTDVSALPDTLPRSPGLQRRTLVLLLAAALLIALAVATAIGIGSSVVRLPIPSPAGWTWTGPMTTPRTARHAVTVLADGRVLVTGETTEIYTPGSGILSAGTWTRRRACSSRGPITRRRCWRMAASWSPAGSRLTLQATTSPAAWRRRRSSTRPAEAGLPLSRCTSREVNSPPRGCSTDECSSSAPTGKAGSPGRAV